LRLEKRHNYVRKVAETATQMFITNDKVNVAGVVLALDPYPDPNPDPSPIRNPNR
jgi:peptide subunit release factor 1 (eRF1)